MSNSLSALPVKRPVLTTVGFIIILVIGLFSLWRLPIDLMPEITNPTITVITYYGNAGPQEMEELITRPLEASLAGIQGIEELSSTSAEGVSRIRVLFTWGTNLDEAVNDIRDRIDRTLGRLPDDVDRPMIRKFDMSSFPIMILGASGDMESARLRQLIEDQVQYRLERCDGVASVDIRGGALREIKVALRTSALEALKISPDMVVNTFKQENKNIPAGSVDKGNKEIIVRTFAEYSKLEDVKSAIVAVRDGVPVTVGDLADVQDGIEEITSMVRINSKLGIQLSVSKQSGVNTVAVAREVQREIERINKDFPQIKITPLINTATFIQQSINGVGNSLVLGGLIAVIVLLLFLRNISSTLIIATAIPVSIIATFALVYFTGLTLNMMTFGGLALGIGMLVDNAIVVLDNIFHHREKGGKAQESAIKGTSQVTSAVIASTLTTLVVFFPVVFIRGMSGIMFRQLAYVVSFSLACSLFSALTLIPMLSSKFLKIHDKNTKRKTIFDGIFEKSERIYTSIEKKYGRLIQWALKHRKTVVFGSFLLLIGSILMIPLVGMELMPTADESEVRVSVEMEVGTRVEVLDSTVLKIESIIAQEVPEAVYIMSNIGGSGWGTSGSHTANTRVSLVPKNKRKRSSSDVANALRRKLTGIPGATLRVREGQGLFLLRMGNNQDQSVGIEIRGRDLHTGQMLAEMISKLVSDVNGVTDTKISRESGKPEYIINIDRKKAADLGLTATQIGTAVQTAMGGAKASTIRQDGKEYNIVVQLVENQRKRIEQLSNLAIVNKNGMAIPLQAVASVTESEGPVQIERRDRERIVTVSVNYAGRDLGSVVEDIRAKIADVNVPNDFAVIIRGDYEEQQKAFRELLVGILMAVLLVYLVMAGQFESFKDPLIIIFSIPMALIGVVGILYFTSTPFSVQAFIGCIILAGIVVNNAIVLIDYTNQLRRNDGIELREAIIAAGVRRLRPIMMSTSTTMLGLLPLALALGEGGETQAPMARVVIGGLLTATLITLLLIPVIYSIVEERHARKRTKKTDKNMIPVTAVVFIAVILFSANHLTAQTSDTTSLSLQDVLGRALKNNPLVYVDKINVSIAESIVKENQYRFEPSVNVSIEQGRDINGGTSSKPYYSGNIAVSEILPTGTSVKLNGGAGSTPSGLPSDYQRNYGITVTQAILANGGLNVNLVPLRKARMDVDIQQAELSAYTQKLLAETELAYWDVYLSRREITIHQKSLELTERLLSDSEERLRVGKVAPLDLVAVKAEAATRKKNLIDAEASYVKKLYHLGYLLNDSLANWEKPYTLTDAPAEPVMPDSIRYHIMAAEKLRPELHQAQFQLQKGELDIVQTKNGLLPKLDLFISLSGTAYASSFGNAIGGNLDNENELSAGLNLSLPVSNGAARQRHQTAKLSQKKAALSLENLKNLIELDVRTAWVDVEKSVKQISAAKISRELQEEKLAAEQARLSAGKSTEYMVLQVQRDLISAQLDEIRAAVTYVNACTNLYLKDGTLLERRGIKER